jgi:hypothetical protein
MSSTYGELHPAESPEDQWDVISVNFIVKLPQAHGYDVVVTNLLGLS